MDTSEKEAENGVFDNQKGTDSSKVFDTKRHDNVKYRPDYRRIRKYYKSPRRWQLERKRRKQVLQLHEEGLSYAEIADRLGVSERTVKRDIAKIKPYYERKIRSYWRKLEKDRIAAIKAELEGKSLLQSLDILTREIVRLDKLKEERKYRRSRITLTVDLDNTNYGFPEVNVTPKPPFTVKMPFTIYLEYLKDGRKWKKCSMILGSQN